MIQRIQTLYLTIGVIALSLLYFFPVSLYSAVDCRLSLGVFKITVTSGNCSFTLPQVWYFGTISTILLILLLVAIFNYKQRSRQINILAIAMLLNLALIGVLYFLTDHLEKLQQMTTLSQYQFTAASPIVSLVMILLAVKAIRRDIALLKSADRLR